MRIDLITRENRQKHYVNLLKTHSQTLDNTISSPARHVYQLKPINSCLTKSLDSSNYRHTNRLYSFLQYRREKCRHIDSSFVVRYEVHLSLHSHRSNLLDFLRLYILFPLTRRLGWQYLGTFRRSFSIFFVWLVFDLICS